MISKERLVEVIDKELRYHAIGGVNLDESTDRILAALAAEEAAQGDGLRHEIEKLVNFYSVVKGGSSEDRAWAKTLENALSHHPASIAQANTGGDRLTETLRKIMLKEHYSWDRSNESLLVIMREGGEMRLASHFEECLLNAIARYDKWGEAAREEDGPCRS